MNFYSPNMDNMFALYWRMCVYVAVMLIANSNAQEDILRNALMAINHRPRESVPETEMYDSNTYLQSDSPAHYRQYQPNEDAIADYVQHVSDESVNDLPYSIDYAERLPNVAIDKILYDYLDDNNRDATNEGINKRMLSSFRERMEGQKSKDQHDKLTEMFLQKLQENPEELEHSRDGAADGDNTEYMDMIDSLWQKYMKYQQHHLDEPIYASEEVRKRQIPADYSTLGWSGVGYRKRSYQPDDNNNNLYYLQYEPKDEVNTPANYERYYELNPRNAAAQEEYVYAKRKRFPVAKRSSNFYGTSGHYHKRDRFNRENGHKQNRRADSASGTDPKVMKDLTNIFVTKNLKKVNLTSKKMNEKNSNKKASLVVTSDASVTMPPKLIDLKHPPQKKSSVITINNKQLDQMHEEPLNIKKKSIDWSNYFGIDRRKKKSTDASVYNNNNNEIDNDWLIKRYNQAVKRSSEFPLNIFRNHNDVNHQHQASDISDTFKTNQIEKKRATNSQAKNTDDLKIGDMDTKLENIEDLIIDEALKYTGAHEGDTDPKEVQQVKDKVISRLAAAYSLEKMRRALSEFKTSLAAQRYALKAKENQNNEPSDTGIASMKKQTHNPLHIERRKCTSKECASGKNYQNLDLSRNDIENDGYPINMKNLVGGGDDTCPLIERRCQSVIAREHTTLFNSLCKSHQLCYLCTPETNPVLLTSCDLMFLSKADLVCEGDVVCQWAGRSAVDHLRDMHESAPMELGGQCDRNICESEPLYTDTDQSAIHLQRR